MMMSTLTMENGVESKTTATQKRRLRKKKNRTEQRQRRDEQTNKEETRTEEEEEATAKNGIPVRRDGKRSSQCGMLRMASK